MKELNSLPKENFLSGLKISLLLCLSILAACKTEQTVVSSPESLTTTYPERDKMQDSLDQIILMRQKEKLMENYQASAARDFDILHTDLDLSFDWANQSVIGRAILTVKPFFYAQKNLQLDAKDYDMGAVYLLEGETKQKLNYGYNERILSIYLPEEMTAEDTFRVEINYQAFPERNSGGGSEAITDTKGLYFIDPLDTIPGKPRMIWTQGETEHNSKWFPTIDRPNERFTQLFKLTVEDSLVTISNGRLILQEALGGGMRKDYWEMDLPHAPYLAALAIGNFAKVEDRYGDLPLGYYVEKGFEKGAAKVFENTPEMIAFFEEKLGYPFPWPKYDQIVVRDFVSGAMENTTASIFMENLLLDEREAIDSDWDYIIAHELFHQWFGDLVTAESWSNLTLNEAFANYSEYLWNEYKYGSDEAGLKLIAEMEGYFSESEEKLDQLIQFQYEDAEDLFDAHRYNKGGVILHMLRQYLGDEAFFMGLNDYLTKHAFQSVEVHDLRLAFERVSGKDLNWFFNQWFLDRGHPELKFDIDYSIPENILITVHQVQDLEKSPVFQFPLEVSWYEGKERKSKPFFVNKGFNQFALENGTPVTQIYLDEGKNLLSRRTGQMGAAQFQRQFEESILGVARYEALDSLVSQDAEEELMVILPQALQDSFWAIREKALGILQVDPSWPEQIPGIEDLVLTLAEKDPKNSVQAGALEVLASWNVEKYQPLFLRKVNAPSYLVAGSALTGLVLSKEKPEEIEFFARFEAENNFRMVIPLAELYIDRSIAGKGDWFLEKPTRLSQEGLYYFLGYLAEYFIRMPEEGEERALVYLYHMMEYSPQNFLRMGAFQALMGFGDQPAVVSKMKEIAGKEQDIQVRNYFDYFLQVLTDEN
ncbi:M1 family metallopeptidase [Algoriphagus confluentis]|uniref:Aminopeptidase N n=1 Tax=Algoriphagus confluentis TaxID=1697556 RepID=A0ABQ6PJS9_9BACT|nr:M1 family metallopeptidase [Algoriphagus confluentis]